MIPMPYRLLAIGGTIIALLLGGFAYGSHVTRLAWEAKLAKSERDAHAAYVAQSKQLNEAAQALEVAKNEKEIVYRTITQTVDRIVDRPVYRNVCLDDDGLRAINAAAAGKAADSGQPAAAVRAIDAAIGNDRR